MRTQTDIILTLTPHIVRILDLNEADLRPFRMGRDLGSPLGEMPAPAPPRDREEGADQPGAGAPGAPRTQPTPTPAFPQPLEGKLPGTQIPVQPPAPKKPGGGR